MPNSSPAEEALDGCIRILSLPQIFLALVRCSLLMLNDIEPGRGANGRYKKQQIKYDLS